MKDTFEFILCAKSTYLPDQSMHIIVLKQNQYEYKNHFPKPLLVNKNRENHIQYQ